MELDLMFVVGVITLAIYKFLELLICRRERLSIIDKLEGNTLTEYLKCLPQQIGASMPILRPMTVSPVGSVSLRGGCLLLGMGLGLIFAFLLIQGFRIGYSFETREVLRMVYTGSLLFFGGLGLVISFIIERVLAHKDAAAK